MKRYPGKFEGCADERLGNALYQRVQDGGVDEIGTVDGFGWYGLIKTHKNTYVVSEDSQGFFDYEQYSHEIGQAMWGALEAEYEAYCRESEESDEGWDTSVPSCIDG